MDFVWVLVPIAYFVGTFPTAQLTGRLVGIDPTSHGSGNPGASNMMRVAGKSAGGLVLIGDVFKGVIATAIGYGFGGRELAIACGAAAVVGHVFPLQRRLHGGKGVATFGGMSLVAWPVLGLAGMAVWFVTYKVTRRASVGSLFAAGAVAIGTVLLMRPWWEIGVAVAIASLILIRHYSNVIRLLRRQETSL